MNFAALTAGCHEPGPLRAFGKRGFRQRRKGKAYMSETVKELLKQARAREGSQGDLCCGGYVKGYCGNQRCDVREVTVHIKESYGPPHLTVFNCPACGQALEQLRVLTRAESDIEEDRQALGLVNVALYRREHGGTPLVPALAYCLGYLPAGWRYENGRPERRN
jgi:hypothetical protein